MGGLGRALMPAWIARLRRGWGESRRGKAQADGPQPDALLAAGRLLREAREARHLSLRQLALETRISTPVLEALERGWRDRLPEAAYLRTMLPLIERHLDLDPGSLRSALPEPGPQLHRRPAGQLGFSPFSIELFTTWQGTALYGLLMLGLLYGLNLEQRRLAAQGLHALAPVGPLAVADQQRSPDGATLLLAAYPQLRPLALASQGQGMAQWRRQAANRPPAPEITTPVISTPEISAPVDQPGPRPARAAISP